MKKPKNRGNMYVVLREMDGTKAAVLGTFSDLVEADNFKDAMAAEWFDKTKGMPASFVICISTYYG